MRTHAGDQGACVFMEVVFAGHHPQGAASLARHGHMQTLRLRLGSGTALPAEFRAVARATPDGRVAIVLDSADAVAACLARLHGAGVALDDIE